MTPAKLSRSNVVRFVVAVVLLINITLLMIHQRPLDLAQNHVIRRKEAGRNDTTRVKKPEIKSKWSIMHMMPRLPWLSNDFCHEHIIRTFAHDTVPICSGVDDSIQCSGAKHSKNMATCSFRGLSMRPKEMIGAFHTDDDKGTLSDFTINLIGKESCPSGAVKQLEKRTSAPTPTKLVKHIVDAPRTEDSQCEKWIEKPALLHVSNAVHIYFKFLDLYNVHKAAFDEGLLDNEYVIVRIGNLANDRLEYMHAEFEERLFGMSDVKLIDLAKEGVGTVCFRKAVMVPNAYASVPFRCKMESSTRKKCIECTGAKEVEHPMVTFSDRVRRTCGLEQNSTETNTTIITLISRKPYTRWKGDTAEKNFHRVLENEDELVAALESASKSLNFHVDVVRLESMDICEQVTKSASSDVLIGVHGAGLVHLWWLVKEHATVIELEPSTQVTNPSFRTLAALSGHKYVAVRAERGKSTIGKEPVRVSPNAVIDEVRKVVDAKRHHG